MKFNLLSLSLVLAATAALAFLPVGDLATGGDILTAVGILAIFFSDYRGIISLRRPSTEIVAFARGAPAPVRLPEAA
jgi:hypothetical protein